MLLFLIMLKIQKIQILLSKYLYQKVSGSTYVNETKERQQIVHVPIMIENDYESKGQMLVN